MNAKIKTKTSLCSFVQSYIHWSKVFAKIYSTYTQPFLAGKYIMFLQIFIGFRNFLQIFKSTVIFVEILLKIFFLTEQFWTNLIKLENEKKS